MLIFWIAYLAIGLIVFADIEKCARGKAHVGATTFIVIVALWPMIGIGVIIALVRGLASPSQRNNAREDEP